MRQTLYGLIFFTGLSLLLPGCSTVRAVGSALGSIPPQVYRLSEISYPPLPPNAPVGLTTGDVAEPYDEIAIIAVYGQGGDVLQFLSERLRGQARTLGADAVIRIDYDLERGGPGMDLVQSATGTAVRTRSR